MAALIIALLEHPEQHAQVKGCLEQAGHEVLLVDSFPRAKSILQEHTFDLIISDVHLENGGSVFDFLKWVKSDPALHPIPFVLFSLEPTKLAKYLADGVLTAARAFGAAKYITMDTFEGVQFSREIAELLPPGELPFPFLRKKVIEMVAKILALLEHPEPMVLISESLEHFGHVVYKADNFRDAMAILRQREVDLIIGDVHLQNGGSIFDFLRWVKGDPHMRAVPFVCFSTEPVEVPKYLSDGVRTAARALGAAKYMTMEKFDRAGFMREIDWLLPQDRVGNYYADAAGSGDGDGDGRKPVDDRLKR